MATKTQQILNAVSEWIFSEDVAVRMEQFAKAHCHVFEYVPNRMDFESVENKLAYTDMYKEFQTLFESEIEKFLKSNGWTFDEFLAACQDDEATGIPSFLLATSEYEVFKVMMLDEKKKLVENAEAAPAAS